MASPVDIDMVIIQKRKRETSLTLCICIFVLLIKLSNTNGQQNKQNNTNKNLKDNLVCPPYPARRPTFLTLPCLQQSDCLFGDLCCPLKPGSRKSRCFQGVIKPLEEEKHESYFGILPISCPNPPVAEFFHEVKKCSNDTDCWPRVCCPEGQQRFCRTPQPHWEKIPMQQQKPVFQLLRNALKYLQCSPQPLIDLFPRQCNLPQDCFPNLCCQEGDKKICRQPRKSILSIFFYGPTTTPKILINNNTTSPNDLKWPISLDTLKPI